MVYTVCPFRFIEQMGLRVTHGNLMGISSALMNDPAPPSTSNGGLRFPLSSSEMDINKHPFLFPLPLLPLPGSLD